MHASLLKYCTNMCRQWTPEMDQLLKEAVSKYGEKNWRAGECMRTPPPPPPKKNAPLVILY